MPCQVILMAQVGAEFLAQHYPVHTVLLPNPTWANHNKIFPLAGIKDVRKYRYFKPATKGLDYEVCSVTCLPVADLASRVAFNEICERQAWVSKMCNAAQE